MKKIALSLLLIATIACQNTQQLDHVKLSGQIQNPNQETLVILGKNFKKEITLAEDGSFSDTLKVEDGFHGFNDGKVQSFVYLRNAYDLTLNFDTQDFPESIAFQGGGAETNNYLMNKLQFVRDQQLDDYQAMFSLEQEEFDQKISTLKDQMEALIEAEPALEPEVIEMEREANAKLLEFYTSNYATEHLTYTALQKGQPSPKFDYPDVNGKSVSLDDLKGKYVYVDVWATWCGPCKKEIPYLKALNEEYQNSDLAIVSLSIDKQEHKEKWKNMVAKEGLRGIQILADKDWSSEFVTAYNITGIPRFILIDPSGNILDADAPRPSDPNLQELLKSLKL